MDIRLRMEMEIDMEYISEESYCRVRNALDNIKYVVNIHRHDYTQWFDMVAVLMNESFETLDSNQFEMTYAAWVKFIQNLHSVSLKKGFTLALKETMEYEKQAINF